jgi:hypothetical protein
MLPLPNVADTSTIEATNAVSTITNTDAARVTRLVSTLLNYGADIESLDGSTTFAALKWFACAKWYSTIVEFELDIMSWQTIETVVQTDCVVTQEDASVEIVDYHVDVFGH